MKKIKISKSQWEAIGKKAGWTVEASMTQVPGAKVYVSDPKTAISVGTDSAMSVEILGHASAPIPMAQYFQGNGETEAIIKALINNQNSTDY